jgi:L-ascorbate metabolism protein UlaG (beta-lactamase superfamily)
VHITYLGHATVVIELDGVRIITDPILRPRVAHLRRHGTLAEAALEPVAAVLLSHAHGDHLDPASIRRVTGEPRVIAPVGLGKLLTRRGIARVEEIDVGGRTTVSTLGITAFEADHDGRRTPVATTRAPALGYLVRGSQSVYFAGDTGLHDAMSDLAAEAVDVALVPVAGWGPTLGPGHMDPREAAASLKLLQPKVAIPIHWGTLAPIGSKPPTSAPAQEFAAAVAELAPAVRCVVIDPGGSSVF